MISKLFLLVIFFIKVYSFNFDTDFPIVFMDPTGGKNYFGYTVSMYPGNMFNKQWIRIGAPIANDQRRPKIARPGIVYDCQVMLGCKPINFNNSEEKPYEEWKHGWMGGTMDVSYKNERVVVCGFRQYYVVNGDYRTMGACLWSQFNSSEFQFIKPLLKPGDGIISFGPAGSAYLYGQSQAGFAAHFPEEENEVILGAPGTLNWAGTPFKVTDIVYENPIANKRRSVVSPAPNRRHKRDIEPFRNVVVPDTTKNDAFNLFGYSVTSGYYYGRDTLYYASGSPKGNGYKGKVVIFKFRDDFEPIDTREKKIGEQIGEYFGASLASGNINGDIYDDLLVGAPFFRGNTYNEGRVYLFLGAKDTLRKPIVIKSQRKAGQFGAAIMCLGDMDNDGYGEVAVGAPYENGNTGSVYIYKGNVDGLYQEPCQKIIGKEIFSDLMGFGITISRAVDMDQNKFKDITVGAHLSGHAVLFRSRPIVAIKYTFASNPTILPEYLRAFEINICFSYKFFDEDSVDVTYTLTIDELQGRALIGHNMTMSNNLTLYKDTPNCENIAVTILDSPNLEIKIPLQASLTYALNYPVVGKSLTLISNRVIRGADKLCVRCPVLDTYKSNQTFYETEIPFTLGCGSDNECHSTLEIDIEFPELRDDTLVLGSRDYIKMKTSVSNAGENAYSTKLYVVLPQSIYFRQTPSKCKSENASAIVCNIANPLRTNTMKSIEFDLDVKAVGKLLYVNQLEIYSKIETTSNNTNYDTQLASLKLTREADITIYGKSEQETNYYGNSSVGSSLLTHTFQIEKYGVSSLERLLIKIQVPHTYQVKGQPVTFLRIAPVEAFFGGQPFMCNLVGVTADRPTPTVVVDENLPTKRRKRQVEVFGNISETNKTANVMINDEEVDVVANTTLYLNCTSEDVTCFEVLCSFGPYDKENIPASIKLNMLVNITEISEFAKYKDMVLISTKGEVTIDSPKGFIQFEDRPDTVVMSSLFINDSTKQSIALWIIILAVIIGLLLLMLLILILVRLGFFKRTKKEELKNLKAAANQEAKILENIEGSKNQEYELETTLHDQEDEITEETDKPEEKPQQPFQTNSSKEHLCDT